MKASLPGRPSLLALSNTGISHVLLLAVAKRSYLSWQFQEYAEMCMRRCLVDVWIARASERPRILVLLRMQSVASAPGRSKYSRILEGSLLRTLDRRHQEGAGTLRKTKYETQSTCFN